MHRPALDHRRRPPLNPRDAEQADRTSAFYDDLAADYHLLFADWSTAIARQAAALDTLISAEHGTGPLDILDCACGIGTQAIGLAARGHRVTAADLSPVATRRAASEAAARRLRLPAVAPDMRHLPFPTATFDVVVCADNAIAHLLDSTQLGHALQEMGRVLRAGGLLVIGTRSDVLRHIQLTPESGSYAVRVRTATSWAITRAELIAVAEANGYDVTWHTPEQTSFGQHLMTATATEPRPVAASQM